MIYANLHANTGDYKDYVGGNDNVTTFANTSVDLEGPYGFGLKGFTGGADGFENDGWFGITDYPNCTIVQLITLRGLEPGNGFTFGVRESGSSDSRTYIYFPDNSAIAKFGLGSNTQDGTIAVPFDVPTLLTLQRQGSVYRGFVNGEQSISDKATTFTSGSNDFLSINGTASSAATGNPNAYVYATLIFNRVLGKAELKNLSQDFYQILEPANQSPFLIGTAAAGGLTIEPTGVSVEVGIGAPTLSAGAVDALPAGVSVEVGIGSPTLSTGATAAEPTGVSIEIGIGSPTLSAGAVDVAATGVSIEVGIGSPTVIAVATGTCQPAGVPVEIGVGSPTLDAGAINISASGVSIEVGIGSPTITSFADLLPSGISVPIGIGSPTLSIGAASVQPDGVSVEVGIGSPSLALQQQYAVPDGVSIPIGIGSPSLSGGSIWTEIPSISTIWTEI